VRRPNDTDPTNFSTATDTGAILRLLREKSNYLSGSGGVLIKVACHKTCH
jgi:hypothetical protein